MRKIFTFLCAALMSVGMWAIPAPTSGSCGDNLSWEFDSSSGTLTITGTGDMYDYDYYGNPAPWFSSKESITSVIISNGLTRIGEAAFNQCTGLTSITIPNSVTSIGDDAFGSCSSLTSIEIPNSVEYIGSDAFYGCSNITDVYCYPNAANLTWNEVDCDDFKSGKATICHVNSDQLDAYKTKFNNVVRVTFAGDLDAPAPAVPAWVLEGDEWDDATKTLTVNSNPGYQAYSDNTEIEHVIINNGVTSLDNRAFMNCSNLESVTIPNSVTSIGGVAFGACIGLTSIEIPNGVEYIAEQAFAYCMGLTSIEIPNSVEYIEEQAFAMCTGLISIEIPNSVDSIGAGAFYLCTGLTSVTIPNSVKYIEDYAFAGCEGLTSITIPNSVEYIGAEAFVGCTAVTDVYCYPNAADLTWEEEGCDDFIQEGDKTVCHVHADQLLAYQSKFTGTVNVTFVDDLPAPAPTDEQVPTNVDPENPSYYYSTFFHSTQNYKLTNDGTTAFIADLSGSDLVLTEIAHGEQVIPANTAVILRKAGSAEPVALTPTEENGVSVNPDENDLEGVDAITAVTSIDGLTRDNCYVLSGQQSVGFYLINSDNLKAHKAYVKYVSTPGQNNAPKKMRFVFNTTTGVESAQPSVISGQKLIENGQLIIIKNGVRYNAQGQIVK